MAFYKGTKEEFKTTQLRADSSSFKSFGDFECKLNIGNYTMVVIGYGSEVPITLSKPTAAAYTEDKCRETFVYTEEIKVASTKSLTLDATLRSR